VHDKSAYRCSRILPYILLLLTVIFLPGKLFPQGNYVTDSLNTLLRQSKNKKADILNELASEYQFISPVKSLELSAEALKAATKEKNETAQAFSYFYIASNYLSAGQYDTCKKLLDRAETIFTSLKNIEGILHTENARANLNYLQGRYDDALKQFEETLQKANREKFVRIQVSSLVNIGRINWLRGNPESALKYYNEALQKTDSANIPFMKGMLNLLIGIVYQDIGYYELAASGILKSIEIFEKMNYLTKLPYAYNYLGSVYFEIQDDERAIGYLRKADRGLTQIGDYWGQAIAYRFMGRAFRRMRLHDSAEYYFRNSLTLALKLNDINGQTASMRFLGEVFLDQGKTDSAYIFFSKSLDQSVASKDIRERVNILLDMGILNDRNKNYSQALHLLHTASLLADSLDLFYENMLINKQLAETYEHKGDFKSSLQYFQEFKSLNDSILSSEKRKNTDELQLKYETEKKNSEISNLRMLSGIQQAQLKNQKILGYSLGIILFMVMAFVIVLWHNYTLKKKANAEKEILLKEIHHRVKNNLQTISSLLSLQSYNINDGIIKDAIRESQERVKSMALIHQMLYQQEKLSLIDFGKYLHNLSDSIASSYGRRGANISCKVECEAVELDIDTAIPLGLIANELIVNAYKYAFNGRDEGNILISLTRIPDGKMRFRVSDNGRGLPEHFRIDRAETLGLRLVSLLTRQLRGEISCNSLNGSEFLIQF
jgi:two-component sensor histidine kinase